VRAPQIAAGHGSARGRGNGGGRAVATGEKLSNSFADHAVPAVRNGPAATSKPRKHG